MLEFQGYHINASSIEYIAHVETSNTFGIEVGLQSGKVLERTYRIAAGDKRELKSERQEMFNIYNILKKTLYKVLN